MSDTVAELQTPPESSGGQRRLLLVVGGAAVLLVLGLAAYFLFLSGGGEDEDLGLVPSAAGAATEQPEKDKGNKDDERVPDEVDTDFQVGRDPFAPLAVEAVELDPVDTEEESTDADTETDSGSDPSGSTGGGSGGSPAPTPTPTPTEDPEPEVTSYKVTLKSVDVAKDSAVIEVNGKRYQVKVKELFTNSNTGPFKLTRVGELPSGKASATIVFGSDAPVEIVQKETEVFKTG